MGDDTPPVRCAAHSQGGRPCNGIVKTGDMCWHHAKQAREGKWLSDRTYRPGIVYALIDRRDGRIRYIGQTMGSPGARFSEHRHGSTSPRLSAWIRECGSQVDLVVLHEGVPSQDILVTEYREIRAHVDAGCDLLNGAGVTSPHEAERPHFGLPRRAGPVE